MGGYVEKTPMLPMIPMHYYFFDTIDKCDNCVRLSFIRCPYYENSDYYQHTVIDLHYFKF